MGFEDKTTRKLRAKLNADHVRTREWQGRTLSYVEGWHALAEANRIFGFDGWNRETVNLKCISEAKAQQSPHCAYIAKVRITVKAGEDTVVREGTGAGYSAATSVAEAHALAAKEAETDATKRALATFGNPFGLALYDREKKGVRPSKRTPRKPVLLEVRDPAGNVTGQYSDPHACAQALIVALRTTENISCLQKLWQQNEHIMRALEDNEMRLAPPGKNNAKQTDPAIKTDVLLETYRQRQAWLNSNSRNTEPPDPATGPMLDDNQTHAMVRSGPDSAQDINALST